MQFQFDAGQFDPTMGLQPWTEGWHDAVIVASAPQPTKAGNGQGFLALTVQSRQEGPNKPQIIRLNLWNANPQAVEIANKELSAITYVTLGANQGRINFQQTEELHNIPFRVLVGRQKDRPNLNEFLAYQDARGNDPKGMGSGTGPQPPQQQGFQPAPAAPGPAAFQQPGPAAPPAAAAPAWMNGAQQAPQAAPAAPAPAWNPNPPQQAAFPPAGPQAQPPMAQPPQQWGQPPAQAQQAPAPWQR